MHDGMPYGRIQGQGQGHEPIQGSRIENLQSREVDRQSPTGLIFRLDALALSVIATATWLGGWLGGWLSHSGIVSKPLNLSENFFDHLKAPSF